MSSENKYIILLNLIKENQLLGFHSGMIDSVFNNESDLFENPLQTLIDEYGCVTLKHLDMFRTLEDDIIIEHTYIFTDEQNKRNFFCNYLLKNNESDILLERNKELYYQVKEYDTEKGDAN